MKKIYKFLRDNKIEDINCLIEYRLGKVVYNNPDNIDIDIRTNPKTSIIYVIMKEGSAKLELSSNNNLHVFLMDNMPMEEKGRVLFKKYIEDNQINTIKDFIECVYNDYYVCAYLSNGREEEYRLFLEYNRELKVKKAFFVSDSSLKININIEDFYEIISSLEE